MLKQFSNHCFQKKNHGHQQNSEAVAQMCSVRKVLLKLSQKSQENTRTRRLLLIKLQELRTANFVKFLETPILKSICQRLPLTNVTVLQRLVLAGVY